MDEARIRAATGTDVAAIVGIVALRNEFPPSGTASRTIWRRLGWKRNGRTSRRHQTIFVWAGESVDLVNDIPSAAEIIDHIVGQEADTLRQGARSWWASRAPRQQPPGSSLYSILRPSRPAQRCRGQRSTRGPPRTPPEYKVRTRCARLAPSASYRGHSAN